MKAPLLRAWFVTLALVASGCGSTHQPVEPPPNVLATVAGETITVEQVRALIPDSPLPEVLVAGGYSGPWRKALDLAVRDELLGREAARRGISGSTRAEQIATLITQEQRGAAGLTVEGISDAEAHTWYQEHRRLFGNVAQADVFWAEFSDSDRAHVTLERAADMDQATFGELVRQTGATGSGAATVDDHGEGADPMISRAAFAVGTAGGVGLSADPENHRWWVVRVERISFKQMSWDAALVYKVKSAMAAYRQEEHLGRLAHSLQKKWPVHVYETRLAAVVKTEESPK
ncbi:MAG TPA: hypothetical protein VGD43_04110 [Micromonospora sp.]